MKSFVAQVTASLAFMSAVVALGADSMQCGVTAGGKSCPESLCCSRYGWCGSSNVYCRLGCQSAFGSCKQSVSSTKKNNPASNISKDTRCGSSHGSQTCQGSAYGDCCSRSGFCGSSNSFCAVGAGCQNAYGLCNNSKASAASATSSTLVPVLSPSPSISTGASNAEAFARDPMENMSNFKVQSASTKITSEVIQGATAHNGKTYIRVVSSDPAGAILTMKTTTTVVSGTTYNVNLYVRSTAAGDGGCAVNIHVGATKIVSSSNFGPSWTLLTHNYTAAVGDLAPTLTIDVVCPHTGNEKVRRAPAAGAGVELDDLTMNAVTPQPTSVNGPSIYTPAPQVN